MTTTMKTIAATLAIYTAGALAPAPAAQADAPLTPAHAERAIIRKEARYYVVKRSDVKAGRCRLAGPHHMRCTAQVTAVFFNDARQLCQWRDNVWQRPSGKLVVKTDPNGFIGCVDAPRSGR